MFDRKSKKNPRYNIKEDPALCESGALDRRLFRSLNKRCRPYSATVFACLQNGLLFSFPSARAGDFFIKTFAFIVFI